MRDVCNWIPWRQFYCVYFSDVNKDWTHKDQDKDKDQSHKDLQRLETKKEDKHNTRFFKTMSLNVFKNTEIQNNIVTF